MLRASLNLSARVIKSFIYICENYSVTDDQHFRPEYRALTRINRMSLCKPVEGRCLKQSIVYEATTKASEYKIDRPNRKDACEEAIRTRTILQEQWTKEAEKFSCNNKCEYYLSTDDDVVHRNVCVIKKYLYKTFAS